MLKQFGLTNMQHLVLEAIWYREGCTQAELSRMLILDKATLSGVVDRLADSNWLEKKEDIMDKRSQRLYSTSKAKENKAALIEIRCKANEELLKDFTHEESVLFKRLLWDLMESGEFP
ncbi:MAG: MarR family transcriptional regulator [Acidobacteria bacterium]|nr:MAG: MarR family transcriptional regulator [Acidobacteriota bacterium]